MFSAKKGIDPSETRMAARNEIDPKREHEDDGLIANSLHPLALRRTPLTWRCHAAREVSDMNMWI
jgi:hypothetical protein